MSVNRFKRGTGGAPNKLELIATKENRVFIGKEATVEAALKKGDIGENSVVYITDDYDETTQGNPTGTIILSALLNAPVGYLLCDGSELDITKYPRLATEIGTRFDPDGLVVKLPDFKGYLTNGIALNYFIKY